MSRILVFLLPIVAVACGQVESIANNETAIPRVNRQTPSLPDNADVAMIVMQFYGDAQALGKKTARNVKSISFVTKFADKEEGDSTVGECIVYSNEQGKVIYKELQLLQPYWGEASWQTKETLLYHELGHCALNLDHVNQGSGAIMEPTVLFDSFASSNWPRLVKNEFASSSLGLNLNDSDDDCVVHVTLN